ncbi:MAG: glycosyltransferase family 4 protein [Lachnospiraceae bacterium]
MHILFISDGYNRYGAPRSMKQLIENLLRYCPDLEISVVLLYRSDTEEYYRRLGCKTYKVFYGPYYQGIPGKRWKLPIKVILTGIEYLIGRAAGAYWLSKKLDMTSVDIIHANSSREDLGAILALKYKKPFVWHIREFGLGCFSFRKDYINLMNQAASELIAVSEAAREHWIKKGLEKEKVVCIYNGVPLEIPEKKDYEGNLKKQIRFLMLGSIYEAKGQYQIIQALGMLEERHKEKISLDIVGDGPGEYVNRLRKLAKQYGLLSHISFLGYQEGFDHKICSYDCGIMCSRTEGFGRVTAEYMMAGLPVIASDIGPNRELVIDQETGLLYEWNNIEDLKEKIIFLLNNVDLLEKMGRRAREYAAAHFTSKRNAELIYKEYLKILDRKHAL